MKAIEFEGSRYDMGTLFGFITANIEYGLRDEELRDELTNYLKNIKL
jgi:UTP--glucose-1-phosphate uridylyltransferase